MALTNKIFIQIDNEVIELKGSDKENFIEERNKEKSETEALKQKLELEKELKISAYKKLGLTDEEIAAII